MIAKVIVWALTWEDAISRGERALKDMEVHGIRTTKLYYEEILHHPEFRGANFTTSFVEDHPELTEYTEKQCKSDVAAAIAVAIAAHAGL
jgi:pyruvate carboxylase subunit A